MNKWVVTSCVAAILVLSVIGVYGISEEYNRTGFLTLDARESSIEKAEAEMVVESPAMALSEIRSYWKTNKEEIGETLNPLIEDRVLIQISRESQTKLFITDEEVTQLTYEITAHGKTDLENTYLIYDFVTNNVSYFVYEDWRDTKEILNSKSGDCTDKSILMVSMLDSLGVESYVVYGTSDYEFTSHAWVAVRIDDTWLYLDPTVDDFYYVHKTLENKSEFYRYYDPIAGMFNSRTALEIRS